MGRTNGVSPATQALLCQAGAAALFLGAVGLLTLNFGRILDGMKGPKNVQLAEIDKARKASELPSDTIRIVYTSAIDPDIVRSCIDDDDCGRTEWQFLAVKTGSNYMLAEVPEGHSGVVIEGGLSEWKDGVEGKVRQVIESEHPEVRGRLLPFGLSARNKPVGEWAGVVALCGVLAAAAVGLWVCGAMMQAKAGRHEAA